MSTFNEMGGKKKAKTSNQANDISHENIKVDSIEIKNVDSVEVDGNKIENIEEAENYEDEDEDDDEIEENPKKRKGYCEYCEEKFLESQLKCVFSGNYRWGKGESICRKCLKNHSDLIIYAFKYDGRFLWYDVEWLLRFKVPHGYRAEDFFTKEEILKYFLVMRV